MSKQWYVVHAYSNYEHKVCTAMQERIERLGMQEYFGELLVPTETVIEMRKGQKRQSERKFFPGYILIEMKMNDASWHLVKETPKVLGFIGGTKENPAPITQREADVILQRVQDGEDAPKPKVLFDIGELVRVTEGPFADFNGEVEDINYEKSKIRVAVSIFGRSTPVELGFGQVEKM